MLFAPHPHGKTTNDLKAIARWFGTVEEISTNLSVTSMVPEVSRPVLVLDKRFGMTLGKLGSLNYIVSNRWFEADDPDLASEVAASRGVAVSQMPGWSHENSRRASALLIVLLISGLGPIWLMCYWKKSNSKPSKTT